MTALLHFAQHFLILAFKHFLPVTVIIFTFRILDLTFSFPFYLAILNIGHINKLDYTLCGSCQVAFRHKQTIFFLFLLWFCNFVLLFSYYSIDGPPFSSRSIFDHDDHKANSVEKFCSHQHSRTTVACFGFLVAAQQQHFFGLAQHFGLSLFV